MNKKFLLRQNLLRAVVVVGAVALVACSSSEPAKTTEAAKTDEAAKKPAGPAEPVTGKTAFYEMYTPAHAWAADILPLASRAVKSQALRTRTARLACGPPSSDRLRSIPPVPILTLSPTNCPAFRKASRPRAQKPGPAPRRTS